MFRLPADYSNSNVKQNPYSNINQNSYSNVKQNPYSFVQAPSSSHQVNVYYNGKQYLQGLSPNVGPIMFPKREVTSHPRNAWEHKHCKIAYPTTHSIPGPYLQSYINLPGKTYMY